MEEEATTPTKKAPPALPLKPAPKKNKNKREPNKQRPATHENTSNNLPPPGKEWTQALEDDCNRLISVGEQCITESELKSLLLTKGRDSGIGFTVYDGFEPSGRMHIAQGVFKAINVNKCIESGGSFIMWVADWFALMNDKMGGDVDKIKVVGEYLQEVWKAAGMNLDGVVFMRASDEINKRPEIYWPLVLDVARHFNISRIKRCCQIMGRLEGSLTAAQLLYPLMQCADVFFLKADICQLGMDQRKVNMLAREYCDEAGIQTKPVILSHHMLYGLKAGQQKMSKSDPDSAVFMEDSREEVERKILNAHCPTEEVVPDEIGEMTDAGKESMQVEVDNLRNPCLDYIRHVIFGVPGAVFNCAGSDYAEYDLVKAAFLDGSITEIQLKRALIDSLNELLEPVREHFANDATARVLFEQVQQFKKDPTAFPTCKPRRLDLVGGRMVDPSSHLVFAPWPKLKPTLQEAVDVIACLRAGSAPRVLHLSDWAACACNACDANPDAITAYHTILVTSLVALDPHLMKMVKVVRQSEAILSDPSNYWISVINVGRHFMLEEVMGHGELQDSDRVARVIRRLMLVADAASVNPASIVFSGEADTSRTESQMITEFFEQKLADLSAPVFLDVGMPNVVLQRTAAKDNDEYFLLDDPQVAKRKMKKAFCQPGNIDYCPPMDVACTFAFGIGEESDNAPAILVSRTLENGGDVSYKSRPEMEADYKEGKLHFGDLKATATQIISKELQKIADAVRKDQESAEAAGTLKALW